VASNSGSTTSPHGSNACFVTTHWSVVLSAQDPGGPRSREALESLCRAYWYPLYSYARRAGHSPHDAEDLTQGFFGRLLEKDYLKAAAREKGRFRTFMLVAFKRYLANEWDRQHAQKRGGFAPVVELDAEVAESRFASEQSHDLPPDVLFDRQWAVTLLDRTMGLLKRDYAESGRSQLFEHLNGCLVRDETALPYAEIAVQIGVTEAAVKMAIHRLRVRYREMLRQEIAQTVSVAGEIEDEIRHLFSAFGS